MQTKIIVSRKKKTDREWGKIYGWDIEVTASLLQPTSS